MRGAGAWHGIQTWGYRPKHAVTDVSLGLVGGTESVLWGCTFAAMIFSGPLQGFLPIGIVVLLSSTALILVIVGISSQQPLHLTAIDEQAVAVVATIALAAGSRMDEFSGTGAAATTILVIMAAISITSGLALHLAARFNIGPMIQLVPFPVVCGFLGGLGWLLFAAAFAMLTNVEFTAAGAQGLLQPDQVLRWLPALLGGVGIFALLQVKEHFLLLPGTLLAGIAAFHLVAYLNGATLETLRQDGWVFWFEAAGRPADLGSLDFAGVNFAFIGSVLPEIATIVALSVLSVSFNLSALELATQKPLPLRSEFRNLGTANIASGMVMGLPGTSDPVGAVTFRKVGASSRTFTLLDGATCVLAAAGGAFLLEYVPKAVLAAVVFFTAFQLMYDWLVSVGSRMTLPEAFAVWSIFAVIVAVGFIQGVMLGILLACLLFIVRYSRIDVVDSSFFLHQVASSVDRPGADLELIHRYGEKARIFNLRGFLFFGSASSFYDQLEQRIEQGAGYEYVVLNFQRVTGMDSTAVQVFLKLVGFLASKGTMIVFCGMEPSVRRALTQAGHAGPHQFIVRNDLDAAVGWVEEHLLVTHEPVAGPEDIHGIVTQVIGDPAKAAWLVERMERLELKKGEYLFRMGERDTSLYVIESGMIEVRLESEGRVTRLRDFSKGTVIGEMAAYSDQKARSAAAVAMAPAVVYRLAPDRILAARSALPGELSVLHEFVARLVVARLIFMNKRLELGL
jgi:SulP family sulfate permease